MIDGDLCERGKVGCREGIYDLAVRRQMGHRIGFDAGKTG
jgi:hypothetical protein